MAIMLKLLCLSGLCVQNYILSEHVHDRLKRESMNEAVKLACLRKPNLPYCQQHRKFVLDYPIENKNIIDKAENLALKNYLTSNTDDMQSSSNTNIFNDALYSKSISPKESLDMSLLEPMDLARNLADSNIISNFEHVSLPKSSAPPFPFGTKTYNTLQNTDSHTLITDQKFDKQEEPNDASYHIQNDDEKMKYLLCQRFLPNAIKHCTKEQLEIRFVTLCQEYLTDCQPYLNFLIPNQEAESALRAIADTYSSSVGLTYYHWGVNGIPYYPINEEGTVSNGAHGMVDYGSWGGGYSNNFDVRDYWRMNSKAGGNWYEGLYGYGTGWNVPIMQNFGAEGGGGTQIHIPIKEEDFGKPLRATNGYFVGPYAGVADSTAVDWLNGRVTKQNGFASPYTGVNVYSGSSVGFPSINSVVKNLARKTKIHNLAQILAQVNTSAHHALN